jgi:hypothetical protein
LSPAVYKNITTLAFLLDEMEWIYHFIQNYTQHLPEEHRDSYYNFNMANYYFKKNDYGKVIELLSHVEYSDFFIQLSAKSLLMKTYFELKEFMPFDSLVHSFKILLQSKKGLGYHRNNYLNFIKYCRKLLSQNKLSGNDIGLLETEISGIKELQKKNGCWKSFITGEKAGRKILFLSFQQHLLTSFYQWRYFQWHSESIEESGDRRPPPFFLSGGFFLHSKLVTTMRLPDASYNLPADFFQEVTASRLFWHNAGSV